MDIDSLDRALMRFNPRVVAWAIRAARRIPCLRRRIQAMVRKEAEALMAGLEPSLKPYRGTVPSYASLPQRGVPRKTILSMMRRMCDRERGKWRRGFVSGAVYHGDDAHVEFLNKVYAMHSQANPLHADVWPSIAKYEADIVSMTARMLGGAHAGEGVCGTVTSGGTESILLAMKTYRDFARAERGVRRPEMVVPETAHAAFDKAAQYFGIKMIKIPVDRNFRAEVRAARKAVGRRTVVIVGSAPSFPHGAIDPIEDLSEIARQRGIGFHTDACLGGFLLPWIERLGWRVPAYDFRLPGVTSVSADTHKYGYAAKGTSVILYRNPELRHYQFYKTTEWPGGLYFSPTFAGSRPGGLSAACWAAMVSIGEKGYRDAAKKIMRAADRIRSAIERLPELKILGEPLWVIAFASDSLDIYRVMDVMASRGWSLNGLHKPPCVHICVTLRHTIPGVADRFARDLEAAVTHVKEHPHEKGSMAPVYGMAASFPDRGAVAEMLDAYLDALYKV